MHVEFLVQPVHEQEVGEDEDDEYVDGPLLAELARWAAALKPMRG